MRIYIFLRRFNDTPRGHARAVVADRELSPHVGPTVEFLSRFTEPLADYTAVFRLDDESLKARQASSRRVTFLSLLILS